MNEELKTINTLPIYIHIPFCRQKCAYCDFYSIVATDSPYENLVDSLKKEFHLKKKSFHERDSLIRSIYFGGGTPSLLDPRYFKDLISLFKNEIGLINNAEITMEANPESLTLGKLEGYREAGINRISIGIQSLDNRVLEYIGRLADRKKNIRAIQDTFKSGMKNVSFDLMFGLPYQTEESFKRDIYELMSFTPAHFSLYSLILHRGNILSRKIRKDKAPLPDDRLLYDESSEILESNGYRCYEISNFCKQGSESIHNLAYWNYDEYEALGPSAVSRIGNTRTTNQKNIDRYISLLEHGKRPGKKKEILSSDTMKQEYIMMNLRKTEGIDCTKYKINFGTDLLDEFPEQVKLLQEKKLIEKKRSHISLTKQARYISNSVILEFFN